MRAIDGLHERRTEGKKERERERKRDMLSRRPPPVRNSSYVIHSLERPPFATGGSSGSGGGSVRSHNRIIVINDRCPRGRNNRRFPRPRPRSPSQQRSYHLINMMLDRAGPTAQLVVAACVGTWERRIASYLTRFDLN